MGGSHARPGLTSSSRPTEAAAAAREARSRAFSRLLEACRAAGCPVCRCLEDDAARYLRALLYEHVTDPATRGALRAARGFCRAHVAVLAALPDSAFGSAIIAADLLGREMERLAAEVEAPPPRAHRRWRQLFARSLSAPRARRRASVRCPACAALADAEHRLLAAVADGAGDARFERAFAASDGLCVPHAERLLDSGAPRTAVRRVLAVCAERWRCHLEALRSFAAKHDHARRAPISDAEARSWQLALELLAGPPGAAGDHTGAGPRGDRPA